MTKLVEDTVAVQPPAVLARASTTCTLPSSAEITVAPDGTLPKLADAGTEIDSAPLTILNVAVVEPVPDDSSRPGRGQHQASYRHHAEESENSGFLKVPPLGCPGAAAGSRVTLSSLSVSIYYG